MDVLRRHPKLVDEWQLWSEDKRVPSGWVFSRGEESEVFFFPGGERLRFRDQVEACAEFIVREIGSLSASEA
jgi:hypothetical protein